MICIILQKLLWKFYQHPRLGTLSRLLLSSKSLPGVMEDTEVPDEPGVCVDIRDNLSEANVKVSSRSNIRNPVKTPPVLQVSSWSHGGHGGS